jgi:hypothetical protein
MPIQPGGQGLAKACQSSIHPVSWNRQERMVSLKRIRSSALANRGTTLVLWLFGQHHNRYYLPLKNQAVSFIGSISNVIEL